MINVTQCPSCFHNNIDNSPASNLAVCRQCNLYFRSLGPSERDIVAAYDKGCTFDQWQNELAARAPLWQKRIDLIDKHTTGNRLLDVGTGDGYFLELIKPRYNVFATEISAKAVEYAATRSHKVIRGTIDAVAPTPTFDAITAWHVLEHLYHPRLFLDETKRRLKPGGRLFIAVPNERYKLFRFLLLRRHRSTQFEPLHQGSEIHLTFFTYNSLKIMLASAGFEVIEQGVDDVTMNKSFKDRLALRLNQILLRIMGSHIAPAMYVVCKLK